MGREVASLAGAVEGRMPPSGLRRDDFPVSGNQLLRIIGDAARAVQAGMPMTALGKGRPRHLLAAGDG